MDANRERAVGRTGADGASYIWLRYSTQFTTGGRTHTIEMEVPVPVGASAEERERLIREAEANMEQLYRRVEGRARGQRPPEPAPRSVSGESAARPLQSPATHRGQPYASSTTPGVPATSVTTPGQASRRETQPEPVASSSSAPPVPTPREAPQPLSLQDRRTSSPPAGSQAPTTRPGIAAELPVTPDLASSASGNMKLGEFIQIIRESWGITPKQALDLLQVKSLNNMNYRDLLRRLEPLVEQANGESAGAASAMSPSTPSSQSSRPPVTPSPAGPRRETGPKNAQSTSSSPAPGSTGRQPASSPAPAARGASSGAAPSSSASPLAGPANIPVYPIRDRTVREGGRAYKFDEEEEEDEQEGVDEAGKAGKAGDDVAGLAGEDAGGMLSALARIKIDDLRAVHGTTTASPGRINALHNVLGDQISDEQFQELLERIWHTSSDKKLKQDQVEALISWAKEDYFEDEVRAVLAVLSEE